MKKMTVVFILSLFLVSPALCETSVWIAETDSSVLYLGGTVHFLRESDLPLPPEFEKAYNASEILVFETDIKELSSPETMQTIMTEGVYSDGRTLDSVLSPETYDKLEKYCADNSLPLASLNKFKPSMIMVMLLGVAQQKLNATQAGVDAYFLDKATTDEKAIKGLESIERQIEVLTSLGDGNEDAFVLYSIEEMDKIEEAFDSLVAAWRVGDEKALVDLFIEEVREKFPRLFRDLFADRNKDWIPVIEKFLITPETEFVLVGTGHLVGEQGVIAQLKKLGYEVEKLK